MACQAWDTSSSPADHAHDWRWQLRHAITTVEQLDRLVSLSREERAAADRAQHRGLPLLLTPYVASLMDPARKDCPIRRQLVPSILEGRAVEGDREDPLGEQDHEVAPHLIRRYPDRALLLVTKGCAVHCRFCTRTRVVRQGRGAIPLRQLDPALSWLRSHPDVREVILSGGDPLLLSDRRIGRLLEAVRSVPHIEIVRIGTRVPGVLPMRVDEALVDALRPWQPIWIMVHFNHPRELTSEARSALSKLVDGGFPVMCQTVLLRGINDDPAVLEELFRGLVRDRVRPYYLLHADVVEGTGHLRTALSRSVEIHASLQGRLSGIALPKLVVDTPGGRGKVVVGPDVIVSRGAGRTTLRTFRGDEAEVVDPPEVKTGDGLAPGATRA